MMGTWLNLALLAVLVATLYGPVVRELTVLGVFRKLGDAPGIAAHQTVHHIADTVHCEDLHYHARSGQIFTACEDTAATRFGWFPPLGNMQGPTRARGSIHVIDPKTMKSTRLSMDSFSGPFVTHGIEVIDDPEQTNAVYIFAVNHLSNDAFFDTVVDGKALPAHSQVELFHHVLGSGKVRHVRSIAHPLITTPNDLYAESPTSFYVTNDHYYREGVMRMVEDLVPGIATWSNVVHVQVPGVGRSGSDSEAEPEVKVALTGLHNNNGMGHGQSPEEVLIVSCISGVMYRARASENHTLVVQDEMRYDSALDNPSYFADPYAVEGDDASGYVQAGLRRAIDITKTHADPEATDGVMAWYTRQGQEGWETKLLLEDDGVAIRSASSAVLVAQEKRGENGEKKAWLFVTGFVSESVIAVEVSL